RPRLRMGLSWLRKSIHVRPLKSRFCSHCGNKSKLSSHPPLSACYFTIRGVKGIMRQRRTKLCGRIDK
ncbi:hypothetical protein NDU88_004508, partial [Pleurodeles waltl]